MAWLRVIPTVVFAGAVLLLGLPAAAATGGTERVSVDTAGGDANEFSLWPGVSADGRFVAFTSGATDLVADSDANAQSDVFVRDRIGGTTELISRACSGGAGNVGSSTFPAPVSDDGRFVAFVSSATDLVCSGPGSSGVGHVFIRDRQLGVTELVTVSTTGEEANAGTLLEISMSGDGRYVVFTSYASNLVAGDGNGQPDAFIRDRTLGITERVGVADGGAELAGGGYAGDVSADGRYVVFQSGDDGQVYVRDRAAGVSELASVNDSGSASNHGGAFPALSADGRFVVFSSFATNLDPTPNPDPFDVQEIFVRDRVSGTTRRVSVSTDGTPANNTCTQPDISDDGRFVVYESAATNLVPGDANQRNDVFVRDRQNGSTTRASVDMSGGDGNDNSFAASVAGGGGFVVWTSGASDLVSGDGNGTLDIFIRSTAAAKTVSEQLDDLIALIESMGLRIENSLTAKVDGAAARFEAGQTTAGCNQLDAFINDVTAQTGRHVTPEQADQLIQAANAIKAAVPCG